MYDKILYIGRFLPFHNGHLQVVEKACELADDVFIAIGSNHSKLLDKNPFAGMGRCLAIRDMLRTLGLQDKVHAFTIPGYPTDDLWKQHLFVEMDFYPSEDIALIDWDRGKSSYYINLFPEFDYLDMSRIIKYPDLNATKIREELFTKGITEYVVNNVPADIAEYLRLVYN